MISKQVKIDKQTDSKRMAILTIIIDLFIQKTAKPVIIYSRENRQSHMWTIQ